ncbi:hypothetical protein [Paraferrimonas sp. SM1919]|uniref:hypothetical protein n=1 Tax=Paraferrimonas sp. SM1919 TaxID=2662263 RepID=UPI0013D64AA2|nr:hypothetical protein [Paraferrimonas sp. SM1919]
MDFKELFGYVLKIAMAALLALSAEHYGLLNWAYDYLTPFWFDYIVLIFAVFIFIVGLLIEQLVLLGHYGTFYKRPRISLAHAPENTPFKMKGQIELIDSSFTAPLADKPCAMFTVSAFAKLEQNFDKESDWQSNSELNNDRWFKVNQAAQQTHFVIEDDGHFGYIDTTHTKFLVKQNNKHKENEFTRAKGGFISKREEDIRRRVLTRMGMEESIRTYTGAYWADIAFREGALFVVVN